MVARVVAVFSSVTFEMGCAARNSQLSHILEDHICDRVSVEIGRQNPEIALTDVVIETHECATEFWQGEVLVTRAVLSTEKTEFTLVALHDNPNL